MNTRDFISHRLNVTGKTGRCASVIQGTDGTFYSYGPHYPLLFKVQGLGWVVNKRGYSNTTAKHIGYASMHASYSVKLQGSNYSAANVARSLGIERARLVESMERMIVGKGPYRYAEARLAQIEAMLPVLNAQLDANSTVYPLS